MNGALPPLPVRLRVVHRDDSTFIFSFTLTFTVTTAVTSVQFLILYIIWNNFKGNTYILDVNCVFGEDSLSVVLPQAVSCCWCVSNAG